MLSFKCFQFSAMKKKYEVFHSINKFFNLIKHVLNQTKRIKFISFQNYWSWLINKVSKSIKTGFKLDRIRKQQSKLSKFTSLQVNFASLIFTRVTTIPFSPNVLFPFNLIIGQLLYTHLPYHNDSIIKTDAWRKTQEDFFRKIFTSHFIARVRKGCWRFACERALETEHKLHILTPLLWPSRCVFLVLLMFGLSEGLLGRVWPSLPHLIFGCLEFYWQLLWDPNSSELNNNSTPTRSPTGSLKSNV